jgi:hypothetical protein
MVTVSKMVGQGTPEEFIDLKIDILYYYLISYGHSVYRRKWWAGDIISTPPPPIKNIIYIINLQIMIAVATFTTSVGCEGHYHEPTPESESFSSFAWSSSSPPCDC